MVSQQMKDRITVLEKEIEDLDVEWDRLDKIASLPELQSKVSQMMEQKREEIKALKHTLKIIGSIEPDEEEDKKPYFKL